jgi:hypothetical protein
MKKLELITNLEDVTIGAVRTYTNALLLEDGGDDHSGPRFRARGFHNEPGNPTFDMVLPSLDYNIVEASSHTYFLTGEGAVRPLARGGVVTFQAPGRDKLAEVSMQLCATIGNDLPLDIERWEGKDKNSRAYTAFWDMLSKKVVRYYIPPFIMLGQQHRIEHIADVLGVRLVCR